MRIAFSNPDLERGENSVSYLAKKTGLSKTKIKEAMKKGAVWKSKDGKLKRLRRATSFLETGSAVSLFYDEKILATKPAEPESIHQAKTFSVWIKPAGIICGGTRFGDHCAINRIVEKKINKSSFLVHRLDRFARGLLVIAHSKQSARQLSLQFKRRTVIKRYQAIASGQVQEARAIDHPIDNREAITRITPLKIKDNMSLMSIEIETGRKHQIRKHLAQIGFPIVGDKKYGSGIGENLQLVSVFLEFISPETKRRISFELPKQQHLML